MDDGTWYIYVTYKTVIYLFFNSEISELKNLPCNLSYSVYNQLNTAEVARVGLERNSTAFLFTDSTSADAREASSGWWFVSDGFIICRTAKGNLRRV